MATLNRMIVAKNFFPDLAIHFLLILIVGLYVRYLARTSLLHFVGACFALAFVLTFLNHTFFPKLSISSLVFFFEGFDANGEVVASPYTAPAAVSANMHTECPYHGYGCPYRGKCPYYQ